MSQWHDMSEDILYDDHDQVASFIIVHIDQV